MAENIVKAVIEFENGKKINLELYKDVAPITVANFEKLANENFYDGLCFHRVIPNFMIQGGGFEFGEELVHKEAESIKGEFIANGVNNTLSHEPGVISMARTMVKDSASSQFFICVAPCGYLDGQYAAFGKVTDDESLKVAVEISQTPTGRWMHFDDVPLEPVVIKTIKIIE